MHHILWEIVDNAMDEALNGYGNLIEIEIFPDNSISVTDHGRGVPVDIHPVEKVPAVELVFTTLHAGGKFNNKTIRYRAVCTAWERRSQTLCQSGSP